MARKESKFQHDLIADLRAMFPGCIVTKNDPNYLQGICDLAIFFEKKWAMLECKKSADESHRPNQDYYVDKCNNMSFARFIYPENRQEVLDELQQTFCPRRKTRVARGE